MEEKTDLRVVKTNRALTESLKYLLTREFLNEITVNEICERAMVRRTTFYKHFSDKYELLMFVIKEILADTGQKAREKERDFKEEGRDFYYSVLYLFKYVEENDVLSFLIFILIIIIYIRHCLLPCIKKAPAAMTDAYPNLFSAVLIFSPAGHP